MTAAELKDWLPIVFERANSATSLWNIEIATILGIIAFVAAGGDLAKDGRVRALLAGGFVVMAGLNLSAMVSVTEQRTLLIDFMLSIKADATADLLKGLTTTSQFFFLQFGPLQVPPIWLVLTCHLVPDAFILLFLTLY
jgi:hypothetical protein